MSVGLVQGNVLALFVLAVTYDPANITGTATTTEQDITVTGVRVGDVAFVNKPSHTTGVTIGNVRVKAADTVSIQWANPTAGAVNPTSESYTILIVRPENPNGLPSIVAN
jgi:hypothetical protein